MQAMVPWSNGSDSVACSTMTTKKPHEIGTIQLWNITGKPVFEDAGNTPRFDAADNFDARSQFGNPNLWGGLRYDPEHGQRTADPNTDR